METTKSADQIRLEAYRDRMDKLIALHEKDLPPYRAYYPARVHHTCESANWTINIHWLSKDGAQQHRFLVFATTGPGELRDMTFDLMMSERFEFHTANIGDSVCMAAHMYPFDSQIAIIRHLEEGLQAITSHTVKVVEV